MSGKGYWPLSGGSSNISEAPNPKIQTSETHYIESGRLILKPQPHYEGYNLNGGTGLILNFDVNKMFGFIKPDNSTPNLHFKLKFLVNPTNREVILETCMRVQYALSLGKVDKLILVLEPAPKSQDIPNLWTFFKSLTVAKKEPQLLQNQKDLTTDSSLQRSQHKKSPISGMATLPTTPSTPPSKLHLVPLKKQSSKQMDNSVDYISIYTSLLKKEIFSKIDAGIQDFSNSQLDECGYNLYTQVSLAGYYFSNDSVSFAIKFTPKNAVHDWTSSYLLMPHNLVCLCPSGNIDAKVWMTVSERNVTLLKKTIICLTVCQPLNPGFNLPTLADILLQLNGEGLMIESRSRFGELHPVLKKLEKQEKVLQPIYSGIPLPAFPMLRNEAVMTRLTTGLHQSQEDAFTYAMSNKVAIIQGSSGTGKKFIGLKLVEAILHINRPLPIVILTSSVQALDEILKQIIVNKIVDPKEVIRIGAKSRDELLNQTTLFAREKAAANKDLAEIVAKIETLTEAIKDLVKKLDEVSELNPKSLLASLSTDQIVELIKSKQNPNENLRNALPHILKSYPGLEDLIQAYFQTKITDKREAKFVENLIILVSAWMPPVMDLPTNQISESTKPEKDDLKPEESLPNSKQVRVLTQAQLAKNLVLFETGRKGKKVFRYSDFTCGTDVDKWMSDSLDLGVFDEDTKRSFIYAKLHEARSTVLQEFVLASKIHQHLIEEKTELEESIRLELIRNCKILGMKVNTANINANILSHLGPRTVIVEEAAMIPESRLLGVLGPTTDHIILIGNLKLSKDIDHNASIDFNVSMMERLVRNDYPHKVLQIKHDDDVVYLTCGHTAKKQFVKEFDTIECEITVGFTYPNCNHTGFKKCHQKTSNFVCQNTCSRMMDCGVHPCESKCGDKHSHDKCQVEVSFKKICGHTHSKKCHEISSQVRCDVSEPTLLLCGHTVLKDCYVVNLFQVVCTETCKKLNDCGLHQCNEKCSTPHSHAVCRTKVFYSFPKCGHQSPKRKECTEDLLWSCKKIVYEELPCKHSIKLKCYKSSSSFACPFKPCGRDRSCGHPCTNTCGEDCNNGDCAFCETKYQSEISEFKRKAKEKIRILQKQQLLKSQLEPKYKLVNLSNTGPTSAEYTDISDMVLKYIQPMHNWYPTVQKIEKVVDNFHVEQQFEESKLTAFGQHIHRKFHGTGEDAIQKILNTGFKLPGTPKHGKRPGMFGQGIYFATDSSKSAQELYTRGCQKLLLCDVLIGNSLEVTKADPTLNANVLKSAQCDSVYAKRDTKNSGGVLNDEYVIFDPRQAIVRYIISYSIGNSSLAQHQTNLHALATQLNKTFIREKVISGRSFSINDPLEHHYRIAEAHFLRMMNKRDNSVGKVPQRVVIESIEIFFNKTLEDAFNKKQQEFKRLKVNDQEVLAFHGTKSCNIDNILKENLQMKYVRRTAHGRGLYFSEYPDTSMGYGDGLLLFRVLPGKESLVPPLKPPGCHSIKKDSNADGFGNMLIIEDSDQMLPYALYHLKKC